MELLKLAIGLVLTVYGIQWKGWGKHYIRNGFIIVVLGVGIFVDWKINKNGEREHQVELTRQANLDNDILKYVKNIDSLKYDTLIHKYNELINNYEYYVLNYGSAPMYVGNTANYNGIAFQNIQNPGSDHSKESGGTPAIIMPRNGHGVMVNSRISGAKVGVRGYSHTKQNKTK